MAKTKIRPEGTLYSRSGVRKKVAQQVSEALPKKGSKKPTRAHGIADELAKAADTIRERAGGGSRKRKVGSQGRENSVALADSGGSP